MKKLNDWIVNMSNKEFVSIVTKYYITYFLVSVVFSYIGEMRASIAAQVIVLVTTILLILLLVFLLRRVHKVSLAFYVYFFLEIYSIYDGVSTLIYGRKHTVHPSEIVAGAYNLYVLIGLVGDSLIVFYLVNLWKKNKAKK